MLARLFHLALLAAGAFAVSRTSPPAGALVVAKSGGQYTTVRLSLTARVSIGSGLVPALAVDMAVGVIC